MLAQLESAWAHRALILAFAVVFLMALCKRQAETITALKHAAPPPETVDAQVTTTRAAGPVHITKHYAPPPPSCPPSTPPQLVAVDYDRGPSTTTTTSDTATKLTPATAPAAEPWAYAGLTLDLGHDLTPRAAELGLEHWGVAAGVGYDWKYRAVGVNARVRFWQ